MKDWRSENKLGHYHDSLNMKPRRKMADSWDREKRRDTESMLKENLPQMGGCFNGEVKKEGHWYLKKTEKTSYKTMMWNKLNCCGPWTKAEFSPWLLTTRGQNAILPVVTMCILSVYTNRFGSILELISSFDSSILSINGMGAVPMGRARAGKATGR